MEWQIGLTVGLLVYIGFLFNVAGFIARDELLLRCLMLCGSGFYVFYYFFVAATPLWDAMLTNAVLGAVNLVMICVVVHERSMRTMTSEMTELYTLFPRMTPGQFRRLLKAGARREATTIETVTVDGAALDTLYFVLKGNVDIDKSGKSVTFDGARIFIGEVAFLTQTPASATVRFQPGTEYLCWPYDALRSLTRRAPALGNALMAHLSDDMARKVAASQPVAP